MTNPYATESGRWYHRDGTPCNEVRKANGEMRPATLRDARKLDLVPSVTTIIKIPQSEALEAWKRNTPDWEKISEEKRTLGKVIHGCIEKHLLGEPYDQTHKQCVDGALACLDGWCGLADLRPEKSFAHELGFGGKCDIHKQPSGPFNHVGFVCDFKSKDFGEGEFPLAYENHAMQIAAYRHGFEMPHARGAIIYVSTQVPGLCRLVEISQDDLEWGWQMFRGLLIYWKGKNRTERTSLNFYGKETGNGERE